MTSILKNLISNLRFADIIDISVISIILYYVLIWLRRRASRSVIITIVSVIVLYTLAHLLNMYLTSILFQAGLTAALLALVLIFQEDIRMVFEQFSSWGSFGRKHLLVASTRTIDSLVDAFTNLARDRIGALVVIKGRDTLYRHLSGGTSLNGRLSVALLYSIFHPATPSHDGAVIIEADRIEKFGVRLPLSRNLAEVGDSGTRHTAALGLAERSDALVLVASEEHGTISVAEQGRITRVGPEQLRAQLEIFYRNIFPEPQKNRRLRWLTRNPAIKLSALVLATGLWLLIAFRVENVNRTFMVPVEYRNVPQYWVVESPKPSTVRISLSGKERAFRTLDPALLFVALDMQHIKDGAQTLQIENDDLNVPRGIEVSQMNPRTVSVAAQQFISIDVPIQLKTFGALQAGRRLGDIKLQPQQVTVLVPPKKRGRFTEISTEPLDLRTLNGSCTVKLRLVVPPEVHLQDDNESSVRAFVTVN